MKNNNLSKLVSEEEVKRLLILFRERFQQQNEFLIRVPARVNLLGTHVDHRGGWLNYVALDKNFWIVGSKRNDT
ncbi:MAG: galactokinase family protein, partial [Candidatus Omnitrophica bacterium]|nr:galactokinase family protein [Candidatus Omnitrophota bacterium]